MMDEIYSGSSNVLVVAPVVLSLILALVFVARRRKDARVQEINIYPVKSCGEIRVTAAKVTPLGFENDRIAQVTGSTGSLCTPRMKENAKLFHIKPSFSAAQDNKKLTLTSSDCGSISVDVSSALAKEVTVEAMDTPRVVLRDYGDDVAAWLEKSIGIKGCRLTGIGENYDRKVHVNPDQMEAIPQATHEPPVSLADEAPFLLTSTSSLADLNRHMKARGKDSVPMNRFRPNIVLEGLDPWEEDTWKKIRIGETAEFWVWQRCGRCAMTTIDRKTLERCGEPLATLSTFRERANGQRNFGMHLIPVDQSKSSNHLIKVNDKLHVLEYDEDRKKEWEEKHRV